MYNLVEKRLKPLRFAGLCALGLFLLSVTASATLKSALGADTVSLEIKVPEPVYADETFYITLSVTRDSNVWPFALGYLYLDGSPYDGYGGPFDIAFYSSFTWESVPIAMSLSAGDHTLAFSVEYSDHEPGTATVVRSITVLTRLPSYTVLWLQKPDEPVRAGKMIHLRFSIQDASGSFVQSDDVRIVVEDTNHIPITEATCGRRSDSIRIYTNKEYYRWDWKTEKDLPEGVYSVTVFLNDAELSPPISITIVSKA